MPTVVCVAKAHGDADEFDSLCRERRIASSICLALMRRDNTFARQASSSRWNQSQHRLTSPRLRLKLLFAPIHECVWLGQSIGIASVTCANPTDRISPNSVPFLTVHQSTYLAACLPACSLCLSVVRHFARLSVCLSVSSALIRFGMRAISASSSKDSAQSCAQRRADERRGRFVRTVIQVGYSTTSASTARLTRRMAARNHLWEAMKAAAAARNQPQAGLHRIGTARRLARAKGKTIARASLAGQRGA